MRCLTVSAAILLAGLLPAYAAGQTLPRGYETIQVTQNSAYDAIPRGNRHGQVVFLHWPDVSSRSTQEIFLYDDRTGELTQLTDDDVQDVSPDINDDGVICWSRGIGPIDPNFGEPTTEIMVRDPDGTITRLTDNALSDWAPRINRFRQMAWYRYTGVECGLTSDIFMFDGQSVRPVTTDSVGARVSHQSPKINDLSEICWTKYDFCDPPPGVNFVSTIMLYSGGETIELTDGETFPQRPVLNNRSQVFWTDTDLVTRRQVIDTWDAGVTSRFTDDGGNPSVNDDGHLAFDRWDPIRRVWDIFLYRDDVFYQLTFDPFWNFDPHVNARGEVAWISGNFPMSNLRFMRRFATGDLNCDGSVDAFDIEPFIFALFVPQEYLDRYPTCDPLVADTNGDGAVDAFDIEPFLTILFP